MYKEEQKVKYKWYCLIVLFLIMKLSHAQVSTTINDFYLPGSQPEESGDLSTPAACSCHQQYDINVEPYFNWEGSMMSQSLRDQLFTATMSIARQDADSSADLCLRCHTPTGWLSGRSQPTNGSALIPEDYTGVNCLFCHRLIMPAQPGENPYPLDPDYIDPGYSGTGLSTYEADSTYMADFISDHIPEHIANGMFVVTSDDERRGPYTNPDKPNHDFFYSPFHQKSEVCGTCHDVSNPVYTNNANGSYILNNVDEQSPEFDPYTMFPIERTYSEWKMSAYNTTPGGITGTAFGGNKTSVSTCQDCHMADVTGKGVNRGNAPTRTDLGLHDFTGGNTFMPEVLKTQYSGDVNRDALDSSISRATWMLQHAVTMEINVTGNELAVIVQNETGHKLPSGYPEGRRIWINVQVYDDNENLIEEFGHYDQNTAVLSHDDTKVYEIKPGLTPALAASLNMEAGPSFHFVLNDTVYSDNRIPPRGFTNANFELIQSPPTGYVYDDGQYTDTTRYTIATNRHSVTVALYYQTTSKEYIDFLVSENITDSNGSLMKTLWEQHGQSTPVAMVQKTWIDNPSDISVKEYNKNILPSSLKVFGPNPFNSQIRFEYYVANNGLVNISIYDISGSRVVELVNSHHSKGNYSINWIANNFASGTYYVRLQSGDYTDIKKITLIK